MTRRNLALKLVLSAVVLTAAVPAQAIPAFARKYGTSCLTCHTVYPKLTPFGEAFRRNGYLFPGVDSDYVKQETVALGQEANKKSFPNAVWPSTIPISVPLSIGMNGQVQFYPDKNSTVPRANNGSQVILDSEVEELHLWFGASFTDTITAWGEVTFAADGTTLGRARSAAVQRPLPTPARLQLGGGAWVSDHQQLRAAFLVHRRPAHPERTGDGDLWNLRRPVCPRRQLSRHRGAWHHHRALGLCGRVECREELLGQRVQQHQLVRTSWLQARRDAPRRRRLPGPRTR